VESIVRFAFSLTTNSVSIQRGRKIFTFTYLRTYFLERFETALCTLLIATTGIVSRALCIVFSVI